MLHLDREIQVPNDFHMGLASERPELLRFIDRPLTREEGRAVADAMATLLSTLLKTQARLSRAEDRLHAVWQHVAPIKEVIRAAERQLGVVRDLTEISEGDVDEDSEIEPEAQPRSNPEASQTSRGEASRGRI